MTDMVSVQKHWKAAWLTLLLLVIAVQPASAAGYSGLFQDGSVGTVEGHVLQGTAGASLPDQLQVGLVAMNGDTVVVDALTHSEADGSFVFVEVPIMDGVEYGVYALFEGVYYFSDLTLVDSDIERMEFDVVVYKAEATAEDVYAEQVHFLVDTNAEGTLDITQVWLLTTTGDVTYVPDPAAPVYIDLPSHLHALAIEPMTEGAVVEQDGRLLVEAPIRARELTSVIVYTTLDSSSAPLELELLMPVDSAILLTPADELMISGSGLLDAGVSEYEGSQLQQYVRFDLISGQELNVRIRPMQAVQDVILLIGIAGVLLILAGVLLLRWNNKRLAGTDAVVDLLTRTIAQLDKAFEEGAIEEDVYRQRRDSLMRQAMERSAKPHD